MTQSPYHRVEFKVHSKEEATSIKLALKPDITLKDALTQVRNVWSAETNTDANLAPVNLLSVKDSEGFWLPQDSAVNCVLKLNDKVDVFVAKKRKPESNEANPPKKAKVDKESKPRVSKETKQTPANKQSTTGADKAQEKGQPPKVQSHKVEGKKGENGGQKRKHTEVVGKTQEEQKSHKSQKANDGIKQGIINNKAKQADSKKEKQVQSRPVKSSNAKNNQETQDKHKKKKNKNSQVEQNKHKKPEHKAGDNEKHHKHAAKPDKKVNGNQKKQSNHVDKAESKGDTKIDQSNLQKEQKPKAEKVSGEETVATTKELTDEFDLNREVQAGEGKKKQSQLLQKEEVKDQVVSEPSVSLELALDEITESSIQKGKHLEQYKRDPISIDLTQQSSKSDTKQKKHKKERHQGQNQDILASASHEQPQETDTKLKKKNKKNKKEKKRKHSHDLTASPLAGESSRADTKLENMEEKPRNDSENLAINRPSVQPSHVDTNPHKPKDRKTKELSQNQATASGTEAPNVTKAKQKRQKAEKMRKPGSLPMNSVVSSEQGATSIEFETTAPAATQMISKEVSQTTDTVEESIDTNIPSPHSTKAELTTADSHVNSGTAENSEDTKEQGASSTTKTEPSPGVSTTIPPMGQEPLTMKSFDFDIDSDSDKEEEEVGTVDTVDEVEAADDTDVAVDELLPNTQPMRLSTEVNKDTAKPDVMETPISPAEDTREQSIELQPSSTPVILESPDIESDGKMVFDEQLIQNFEALPLEPELAAEKEPTATDSNEPSTLQVEEVDESISSQAIIPSSIMHSGSNERDATTNKKFAEYQENSSSDSSSDSDDDDAFDFSIFTKSEEQEGKPDGNFLQTSINILDAISIGSAKSVDVKEVQAAIELRKVCDEELKSRLTRAIKNGSDTVKSGKERQQLKAAQLGDDDGLPTSGLVPDFMSKTRAPTLSEIYANSQRYIYKSIHGRSPPPSPSGR